MNQPSRLMLSMESVSHQCHYPSLDAELAAIHEMLQKWLLHRFVEDAEE